MAAPTKVLVIDDEDAIRRFLRASLSPDEFQVLEATSGREGIASVATNNPDIVLLDLGLPDMDGLEVTKAVRGWSHVPIIVLSARDEESDKVAALDFGADDYLTKPFGVGELLARIRVALRNAKRLGANEEPAVFEYESIKVDFAKRQVFRDGNEVRLTPTEYKLLCALVRNAGKVITHKQLMTEVWGAAYVRENHYLRIYTGQLRHKLEAEPARPKYITTEPGVGYRFKTKS